MAQLNLHVTQDFEKALRRFMRLRGLTNKSEAVRLAVKEAAERAQRTVRGTDFRSWIGAAMRVDTNPAPRFRSDDDLWS